MPAHAIEIEGGEGAVESRSSPRQIHPSAVVAATTAYAGAWSEGRGMRSIVSAGAAARAVVRVEIAGLAERVKVSVPGCCMRPVS